MSRHRGQSPSDAPKPAPGDPARAADRMLMLAFEEAGQQEARRRGLTSGRRGRSPALTRTVALALVGALGLAGAAAATHFGIFDAGTLPNEKRPAKVVAPAPDLAEARATLPGETWGLHVYSGQRQKTCVRAGRIINGKLGIVHNGQFWAFPKGAPGFCSYPTGSLLFTIRVYPNDGGRTILYGVAGETVRALKLNRPGTAAQPIPIAHDGTFIAAFRGINALRNAQMKSITTNGHHNIRRVG